MPKTNLFVQQRRALIKFWLAFRLPIVAMAVVVVLAGGAAHFLDRMGESTRESAGEQAQELATIAARQVSRMRDQHVTAAVQAVDALFAGRGNDVTADEVNALRRTVPDLQLARLFLPAQYKVDYDATPPVNFATVALLRSAERDAKDTQVEFHFHDQGAHLTLAHPLTGPDGVRAIVLLVFSADVVKVMLKGLDFGDGYLELRQVIPGSRPVRIVGLGDNGLRTAPPSRQSRVPGSPWRLAYWHPLLAEQPEADTDPSILVAGGAGLVLLAGIAAAVMMRRRKRNALEQTQDGLTAVAAQGVQVEPRAPAPLPTMELGTDADGSPPEQPESADSLPPDADAQSPAAEPDTGGEPAVPALSGVIFRAYDIRGIVGAQLDAEIVYDIGRAIGSEAYDRGQQALAVGRDGRNSSVELADALIRGLLDSGRDVIDVGQVPTPLLYFAAEFSETRSGVMVTGSHNPAEYNGLKIMLDGETLFDEKISALKTRIESGNLESGEGTRQELDITAEYIRRITEEIPVALGNSLSLVVDCGNGVAGDFAPKLMRALGHDVHELFCEVDGGFPNHDPDPSQPENLADLIQAVRDHGADLGLAFDGDGDRLAVVDGNGVILWPDRQLMLFARDVLQNNPGASIVFDVKCTSRLPKVIEKLGGKPIMWKTGHSFMKNKLLESGAMLAGEMSGHIFFKDRWYGFDDALYAAARMLEILMGFDQPPADIFAKLPTGVATHELRVDLAEGEPETIMQTLLSAGAFTDATVIDLDGIRAEYADAWGLVRASNTTPSLVFRFEGNDEAALSRVKETFKSAITSAGVDISLPF